MVVARVSGVQKEVFALYRSVLREAAKKDREILGTSNKLGSFLSRKNEPATTTSYAASEFRRQAGLVKRSEFKRIEHKIRFGEKQVKLLRMPGVKVARGTTA
jgi:hypothetical protein